VSQKGYVTLLGAVLGAFFGLVTFTFGYARGASYLTNDPNACANCHVMLEQFDGWRKSSHHRAAVCNDCHTPPGLLPKYFTKALNGFNHSWAFTTGRFPENIEITARNRRVTNSACAKCHEEITTALRGVHRKGDAQCITCHRNVGHVH
jgi:cytochrome c nitrite reductase small subunit